MTAFRALLGLLLVIPGISFADSPAEPNYSEHIRPILQAACIGCHSPGQGAPMSLRTYAEVRPWAKAIRSAVVSRIMPPFHAAGPIGRYIDDPRLTEPQIALVRRWVDLNCPAGPAVEPPIATPDEAADAWPLGQPDLVLETLPYEVIARATDDYTLHFIDYVFPEDTWLGAVDFRFSQPGAVHHTQLHQSTAPEAMLKAMREEGKDHIPFDLFGGTAPINPVQIGGWLPGWRPAFFAPGEVTSIPAGSRLALMNHYAPVAEGEEVVNSTRVALYFFTGEIREERGLSVPPFQQPIRIKPHQADFRLVYEDVIKQDAWIDNYQLHMHYRGKSGAVTLIFPDGRFERIFEVPHYDFNWQRRYYLKKRLFAPAGTRIRHVGVWDNSADNLNNPDPSGRVTLGFGTRDEMWGSELRYVLAQPLDEPIRIVAGRRVN